MELIHKIVLQVWTLIALKVEIERQRERERDRDRETERQRDRETERQTEKDVFLLQIMFIQNDHFYSIIPFDSKQHIDRLLFLLIDMNTMIQKSKFFIPQDLRKCESETFFLLIFGFDSIANTEKT